ncbi:hypothetical protein [Nostoc sp.]
MSGINDHINWNLTRKQTLFARKFANSLVYIPPISIVANSHLMMFGFKNVKGKPTWKLAADLYQNLLVLPSSTSQFQAAVETSRFRCSLNTLTLINFPDFGSLPFAVEIRFPIWHTQMYFEAWWYSGDKLSQPLKSLTEIKSQLTNIESKIDAL